MPHSAAHAEVNGARYSFLAGVLGNLALAVLKLSYGLFGYSRLVVLDGLFSLMAATMFLLAWQAAVLEEQRPDERYPYGLGKLLFLSMAVVGALGLVVGIHTLFHSVWVWGRLEMYRSYTGAIMVAIISIVANGVLYRYVMGKDGGRPRAIIALSARYNHIDVWISACVLLLLMLASLSVGYVERLGVAAIALVVLIAGIRLVYAAFAGIMDKTPPPRLLDRIRSYARNVDEVKGVLDVKARYLGTLLHVYIWIAVDESISMGEADGIARRVEVWLMERIPSAREVNVVIA